MGCIEFLGWVGYALGYMFAVCVLSGVCGELFALF